MEIKLLKACLAEFQAMCLFVFVGCGTAMAFGTGDNAGVLAIALSFGLAITVLVYMTAHTSGGHVNCAVTFALMISGDCEVATGVCYIISQILGSIAGAGLLALVWKKDDELARLGMNAVNPGRDNYQVWFGEALMTYLLVTVIYQTAVEKSSLTRVHSDARPAFAPVPIGLAVFLAHQVLITLDGCSINPTRTLGPAVIGAFRYNKHVFDDFYIFMLAPLVGAGLAALQENFMRRLSVMVEMQPEEKLEMTTVGDDAYPQKEVVEQPSAPQQEV